MFTVTEFADHSNPDRTAAKWQKNKRNKDSRDGAGPHSRNNGSRALVHEPILSLEIFSMVPQRRVTVPDAAYVLRVEDIEGGWLATARIIKQGASK